MSETEAKDIFKQVATGLKQAHSLGIAHRDIKHSNIMKQYDEVQERYIYKLIDFGLATILTSREKSNEWCGTLTYWSPEIVVGKPYDHRTDIWSLGVVLYQLLVTDFPFYHQSENETML